MKVQGNRYINNPEMIKNKVEKKTTVPQNIISEDDVKISDSARKLVETARNKVSDFHTMHFSSINGEIREIPAEYKCENLFKLDLKATSISGEQSAFEGCSENQSEVFGKWLDENASEYLTEDEMKDLKEKINTMTADMDTLYDALQMELDDQKEHGFNETVIDGMKGFIFMNRFGNIHNPQAVNRAIKRIYEAHNAEEVVKAAKQHREPVIIPHFSCHHLRHTFCSRFCENETNLKVIQSIMGHANIETTMDIYAEVTDTKKQEAIQNLAHNLDVF
jgi:hypothetical protein